MDFDFDHMIFFPTIYNASTFMILNSCFLLLCSSRKICNICLKLLSSFVVALKNFLNFRLSSTSLLRVFGLHINSTDAVLKNFWLEMGLNCLLLAKRGRYMLLTLTSPFLVVLRLSFHT